MDNTVRVQVSVAAPASPQGGLRNSSPSFGELFAYTPCGSFTRRKNARRSFAPRFSLRCKTVAPSLIFTPRVRLAPPFCKADFATALRVSGSCSHIHLAAPLRVAKMQDVRSLLVFRSAAKLSLTHHSHVVHPLLGQSAYSDGAGQRGRKKAERPLRFFVFCCFDAFTSWRCTRKAP